MRMTCPSCVLNIYVQVISYFRFLGNWILEFYSDYLLSLRIKQRFVVNPIKNFIISFRLEIEIKNSFLPNSKYIPPPIESELSCNHFFNYYINKL